MRACEPDRQCRVQETWERRRGDQEVARRNLALSDLRVLMQCYNHPINSLSGGCMDH
jgi:hypothetical protein